jgi:hypothetical protein
MCMQQAKNITHSAQTKQKTGRKKKKGKKIGLAMTQEMYDALDNVKTKYYVATVPELCRIVLTKFLERVEK